MRPPAEQWAGVHAFCFHFNIISNHYRVNLYDYSLITKCVRKFVLVVSTDLFCIRDGATPRGYSISNTESALGDYNQRHLASALRTVADSDQSLKQDILQI